MQTLSLFDQPDCPLDEPEATAAGLPDGGLAEQIPPSRPKREVSPRAAAQVGQEMLPVEWCSEVARRALSEHKKGLRDIQAAPARWEALLSAVEVVARAKTRSYGHAMRGQLPEHTPEQLDALQAATRLLHYELIGSQDIPLYPGPATTPTDAPVSEGQGCRDSEVADVADVEMHHPVRER